MMNKTMDRLEKDKVDKLERALLELGAEVLSLKSEVSSVYHTNGHLRKVLSSLRQLLSDKDLIATDEFDHMVDVDEMLANHNAFDSMFDDDPSKNKKTLN